VHAISCHRNREELGALAARDCDGADVVIGVGGLALALPGVLPAWVAKRRPQRPIPVGGVALGKNGSTALQAARLSIEELPGKPVILDEVGSGRSYFGEEGLFQLLMRIHQDELPGPKPAVVKEAAFGLWSYPMVAAPAAA
jgi:phosphoribosylcarboxyaminoimidazole (NCAIR) mutase